MIERVLHGCRVRGLAACLACALLVACQGGQEPPEPPAAAPAAPAAAFGPLDRAEAFLDWAEASTFGPLYFWTHARSATHGPFQYRYYERTGVYLGLVVRDDPAYRTDGVYVMGGPFGDQPLYVGASGDFMAPLPDPATEGALAFTPARLTATYNEGDSPSVPLVAVPRVALSGVVYVVVEDPGQVLARVNPVVIDQNGHGVTQIQPRSDLPPGLHEGTLRVHLCRSADCSSSFAGSPVSLPYRWGVVRRDPSLGFFAPGGGPLSATLAPGASARLQLNAQSDRWPVPPLHYRVLDASGRVGGSGALPAAPNGSIQPLELTLTLPDEPGRYDGGFQLQGCRDADCRLPVMTATFGYIGFREVAGLTDASVGARPELRPLRALPGAVAWSGAQGNAAHTGYVPGTLDPQRFALRWTWALPEGRSYTLGRPSAGHGRVALAAQGLGGNADTELFVLSESDGTLQWRRSGDFGAQSYFSPPALSATRLYSSSVGLDDKVGTAVMLRAFDLASGQALFSSAVPTQWHGVLPPVLAGSQVLVDGGQGNGVASLDASSGRLLWQALASGYSWWTPAFDGQAVYSYGSGTFAAFDASSGERRLAAVDAELAAGFAAGPRQPQFAVADGRAFVVDSGHLVVFDTRNGAVLWRQSSGAYVGGTAVQGGVVIALQQGPLRVEARQVADGRLLWSRTPLFAVTQGPDLAFVSEPLLTDNLVFVSTERGVYAFARDDGRPRWYWGRPATLALSPQGVLVLAHPGLPGQGGGVTAIQLQ